LLLSGSTVIKVPVGSPVLTNREKALPTASYTAQGGISVKEQCGEWGGRGADPTHILIFIILTYSKI
jgi:hypothetical protein